MPGSGSQYGGYDAFGLEAFAPGDYFAGVRETAATRGGAGIAITGAGGPATVNLLGLGLLFAILIALEYFRP